MDDFELYVRRVLKKSIVPVVPELNRSISDCETLSDLNLSGTKYVQVLLNLESETGLDIPDEDAVKFETYGDILSFLIINIK